MFEISKFVSDIMTGLAAGDEVINSIEKDAEAGIAMSPAQQLVLVRMMKADHTLIRVLAGSIAHYEDMVNLKEK